MCGRAHPHLQHICTPPPAHIWLPCPHLHSAERPLPRDRAGRAAPRGCGPVPAGRAGPDTHQLPDRHLVQVAEAQVQLVTVQLVLQARPLPATPGHGCAYRRVLQEPSKAEPVRAGAARPRLRHPLPRPRPHGAERSPCRPGAENSPGHRDTGTPVPLRGTPERSPASPASLAEVRSVAFTVKPSSWGKEICHPTIAPLFVSRGTQHPTIKQPFND